MRSFALFKENNRGIYIYKKRKIFLHLAVEMRRNYQLVLQRNF